MSTNEHTYIGVYVECINPVTETPVMGRRCMNLLCKRTYLKPDDLFCPACGQPTREYQESTQKSATVNAWEVGEQIDEELFVALDDYINHGVDVWLPNRSAPHGVAVGADEESGSWPVSPHDIQSHMDAFGTEFIDALHGLQMAYGESNVTVKWGVVKYVS